MGPLFLPNNAADTLAWAHYCCQKNAADGHEWAQCFYQETKKCCQYPCMGPLSLPKKLLQMATNGPSVSTKKCCRYPCMGPLLLPKKCCRWPQMGPVFLPRNQEMLPIPLNGPTVSTKKCCQVLEWVHC